MLYLVPSDVTQRAGMVQQLETSIHALQAWTARQGDGGTFAIANPVVRVIQTSHPAAWYQVEQDGGWQSTTFQNNVVNEGFAAVHGGYGQPRRVWLMYIDADPRCGSLYGGAAVPGGTGVAVLPANDLRGMAGVPTIGLCTGMLEPSQSKCRWVGGAGHELGHAMGLPHPPGCEAHASTCDSSALMWFGYSTYPSTYWREDNLATLAANPLFGSFPVANASASCP